ncbi:Flp family type IVb pilin [Pseudomonas sp.]|uniref:Flp family type IVb pilin n=1 Tax=Pseudomonas sp. TaxID=306 RepID=UPI002E2FFFA7|nr:Flp family type IVb pilin [Pseudomonas sp.]HEX4551994.1 Flp family type IVb pilin [Pseudomonas sp.]
MIRYRNTLPKWIADTSKISPQNPIIHRANPISQLAHLVKRFANDESGATAIEYGLIAAGISVAIITVVNTLGSQLKATFTNVSSQLATAGK